MRYDNREGEWQELRALMIATGSVELTPAMMSADVIGGDTNLRGDTSNVKGDTLPACSKVTDKVVRGEDTMRTPAKDTI